MELLQAKAIAIKYRDILSTHCERIEIAGSIRRKKHEVKDIELVCIPIREENKDLFEVVLGTSVNTEFVNTVNQWEKIKGSPEGKYTQRKLPEGITLDLFMVNPENWGLQLAIRTGSAEYSHRVLASAWKAQGYKSEEGVLYRQGRRFVVREETDLFDMLGLPYVEPLLRND